MLALTNHPSGPGYCGNFKNTDSDTFPVPVLNINPAKSGSVTLDKMVQDIQQPAISHLLLKQVGSEFADGSGPLFFHGFLREISRVRETENNVFHRHFTG